MDIMKNKTSKKTSNRIKELGEFWKRDLNNFYKSLEMEPSSSKSLGLYTKCNNISYDLIVIRERCKELLNQDIPYEFLFRRLPKIDLKSILVLANYGSFQGSSLDRFSAKISSGRLARTYIQNKNWDRLLEYIKQEANAFLELYRKLIKEIPKILPVIQWFNK